MSVSGSRAAVDIDLDDFEKRLRMAGTPAAGVEDPLAELARLVEASRPKAGDAGAPPVVARAVAPVASAPPVMPAPPPAEVETPLELESGVLRPAFDGAAAESPKDHEAPEADAAPELVAPADASSEPAYEPYPENLFAEPAAPQPQRSRRWLLTVSALVVAGVGMVGAVLALKGGLPGLPKTPPFIAAAIGPTKVQPPSDATVSTSSDAGASLLKDNTQTDHVKVVSSEEQPVDLNAQTAQPPAAQGGAANSAGGPGVRGVVDTPLVVMTPAPSPAPASSFPEPKPVRTISLRPDGTPIPASAASAAATQTPPPQPVPETPKPSSKPAGKPTADAASAEPSTTKIDLPTKLSAKSSARVVVGRTDTTAPGGATDASGEPVQLGRAAGKPDKAGKGKTQEAAAEPAAPAAAEPTASNGTGDWAVQLAAPRSESEAKSVMGKLKDQYAAALGGKWLGVHKATVNGSTIYRVRVTGLSKPDAAALCARLKGDGGQCFVAR